MKANLIEVFPDNCRGCRLCEMACSFRHERESSTTKSRIKILKDNEWAFDCPLLCIQCAEAPCIDSCPTGALFRDGATGEVVLEAKDCTGCEACVAACPIGAPVLDKDSNIIFKCDLCSGDPECVKWCSNGALILKEADLDSSARKAYMVKTVQCLQTIS